MVIWVRLSQKHVTPQGWVDLAAMLEKLQMDRVALLLDGEPWKEKNSALQARDKAYYIS